MNSYFRHQQNGKPYKRQLMYTPKHYKNPNIDQALEFMKCFNFGTIITSEADRPIATHLPFIISKRENQIIITSHFAKANEQATLFETKNILTIFSEPHAYISPKFYDKKQNVPTWNYVSVHAYGTAKIIDEEKEVFHVLEQMINSFESDYLKQWHELPISYKSRMAKGITAFEITVNELQFKEKLSQNKTAVERKRIIDEFSESDSLNEKLIAKYMSKNNK